MTVPAKEVENKTAELVKRSVDNIPRLQPEKSKNRGNRHRRRAQFPSFPQQPGFNPYGNPNFGFSQQNANGNAFGQNQNPFFNQNAGANTHSQNLQNPFGNFQNNGGSSISSNLANNGLGGQVSAANTDQQSYLTALGSGQKNNALGQSAVFDPFGNLQTSSTNAGNQHTIGADGEHNLANSASNAHNQNQFGNSDSGAQTLTESFEGPNGLHGEKASSSSHSSQMNNYGNFGGNPAAPAAPAGFPGFGGGVYTGFPQQGFGRFRRSARHSTHHRQRSTDAVVFPREHDSNEKEHKTIDDDEKLIFENGSNHNGTSNDTASENGDNPDLNSRFGLPGHPVRTFLRETIGGIFSGGRERGGYGGGYGGGYDRPHYSGGGGGYGGRPQHGYQQHYPSSYEPEYEQPEYEQPEYERPEYERPNHYQPG